MGILPATSINDVGYADPYGQLPPTDLEPLWYRGESPDLWPMRGMVRPLPPMVGSRNPDGSWERSVGSPWFDIGLMAPVIPFKHTDNERLYLPLDAITGQEMPMVQTVRFLWPNKSSDVEHRQTFAFVGINEDIVAGGAAMYEAVGPWMLHVPEQTP